MDKENYLQSDLFSRSAADSSASLRRRSMLGYLRGCEKVIIVILSFMVVSIVSFSLGVEKGKQLALARNIMPVSQSTIQPVVTNTPRQENIYSPQRKAPVPVVTESAEDSVVAKLNNKPFGKYTIQVGSFKASSFAQKEAQALKKRGFTVTLLPKGKYVILCVGSFSTKETAKIAVSQLQKKYNDCFLRRL